ncbi:MAG: tetratricopeptide repeat protein [Microcoleaceae cyanobacterium]
MIEIPESRIDALIDALQQQADDCLTQGKYQDAITLLTQVLAINPQLAHAHFKLGEAFLAEKQFQNARLAYQQSIQLNPNVFIYYVGWGRALAGLTQWNQAIQAYQIAIALNPDFSWSYTHLGLALLEQSRYSEAIAIYRQDIQLNPNFYWSHFHLGEALLKLGEREEAIAVYRQAIALNPDHSEAQIRLKALVSSNQLNGDYWLQRQDWDAAIKAYQQTLEVQADYSWAYYGLGCALQKKQQWQEAINAYQNAIEINPDFSRSHSNLGYCLFQQGQITEAIKYYNQALEINSDVPETHLRLGDVCLIQGSNNDAVNHYLKAIQLYPTDSIAYLKLRHLKTYKLVQFQPDQIATLIAFYQKIIQDDPGCIESYVNLGDLLTAAGKLQEAINIYQQGNFQKLSQSHPEFVRQYWDASISEKSNFTTSNFTTSNLITSNVIEPNFIKPNFIIIGAQKSGTTSLYEYLCQHPQVLPPLQKEIDFFVWQTNHGLDWYLAHFPPILPSQPLITGEASPSYMLDLKVAQQLKNFFPEIKLIVLLRNPIDRAFSQYQDHKRWINPEPRSLEKAIEDEIKILQTITDVTLAGEKFWGTQYGYLLRGMYVYFLEKWMSILPREQFLILQSKALYTEPEQTMNGVFEFLNLPAYSLSNYSKYTTGSYQPLSETLQQTLSDFFRPHNQKLEIFLNETLPWD